MSRDYRLYLDDIIEAIRRIKAFTDRMDFEAFSEDIKTQDAVVRNLEIIGEASGRLPDAVRHAAPEIEWRKVVGIRNVLAHGYFGISLPIIWDVVQNKLQPLETSCRELAQQAAKKGGEKQ